MQSTQAQERESTKNSIPIFKTFRIVCHYRSVCSLGGVSGPQGVIATPDLIRGKQSKNKLSIALDCFVTSFLAMTRE